MKKLATILFLTFISFFLRSQDTKAYWDSLRVQEKTFKLEAYKRIIYELDIPYGTTELICRVTMLQINQDIPNKLANIVGKLGSKEAVIVASTLSLTSVVMGKDKCKFFIFQNAKDAANYRNNNIVHNACFAQSEPTSTNHAYFNNSGCININSNKLYLGIETTNISLPSNIIIELAPKVDPSKERGWTKEGIIKAKEVLAKSYNEDIIDCMMNKLVKGYDVREFFEISKIGNAGDKILQEYSMKCLDELGMTKDLNDEIDDEYRDKADSLIDEKNYAEAIDIYLMLDEDTVANDMDYNSLGWCYILTKQYLKAIKYLKKGEKLDETNLLIQENLAHAYLLSNNFEKAKEIYMMYKGSNVDEKQSWEDVVKEDFKTFSEIGIKSDKFSQILEILKD